MCRIGQTFTIRIGCRLHPKASAFITLNVVAKILLFATLTSPIIELTIQVYSVDVRADNLLFYHMT